MPQGGQLTVFSKLDPTNNRAIIKIQDTGYGISEENQQHIFDPFFTTKEEGEGTGLGLSLVYGVVKNHKGNIKIESTESKGSAFILDFPVR